MSKVAVILRIGLNHWFIRKSYNVHNLHGDTGQVNLYRTIVKLFATLVTLRPYSRAAAGGATLAGVAVKSSQLCRYNRAPHQPERFGGALAQREFLSNLPGPGGPMCDSQVFNVRRTVPRKQ